MQKNIKNFANQINFFYKQASICWPFLILLSPLTHCLKKKRNKNHSKKNKKKFSEKNFQSTSKSLAETLKEVHIRHSQNFKTHNFFLELKLQR